MPGNLLGLILLLHLAGAFRQPGPSTSQGQQAPKRPEGPQGIGNALGQTLLPSVGGPSAQGPHGIGQGYHGGLGPVMGGLGSMRNQAGLYPHQQNPFSFMAGVR